MKPFNLEAAKRGEPIQTRAGTPVQFIAHVPGAATYKVVALLNEGIETFTEEGTHCKGCETDFDLFMAPKKRTVWVNLSTNKAQVLSWYDTQEDADNAVVYERIGNRAWPLEIEE